jgi:hypothetical protein
MENAFELEKQTVEAGRGFLIFFFLLKETLDDEGTNILDFLTKFFFR